MWCRESRCLCNAAAAKIQKYRNAEPVTCAAGKGIEVVGCAAVQVAGSRLGVSGR